MAARGRGLGHQGRAAIERSAAEERERHAQRQVQMDETPAATSTTVVDEAEALPQDWFMFDSSRVVEAAYNSRENLLFVRFVKPVAEGGTPWTYEGVPANVWRNFRRSASPGQYVNRVLNGYNNHAGHWGR